MPISTTCPKCEALFRLPDELAGRTVKCQKCAALFVMPSAGAETTMPGAPVGLEMEPALEEAHAASASAAPLHGIALPPMPTDTPGAPPRYDDAAELDRFSDSPRKAAPGPTKKSDPDDRPSRARRDEKPKAGTSRIGILLGIFGFLLLAFVVCAGATGIWYAAVGEKKKAAPIAKAFPKKEAVKFGDFQNPPNPIINDGFNGVVENRLPFDGFKDGKEPEPPPPGPPGSIPVIFGADGTFRNENEITLNDPENKLGKRHKLYIVRLEAGYTYQFDMMSNPKQVDAFLFLRDDKGDLRAENDDIQQGVQRNSRLIYAPIETGVYHLEATYWDPRTAPNPPPGQLIPPVGAFTLTVRHVK